MKFAFAAALICFASNAAAETAVPVELRILAINDFHGNLRPPPGGIRIFDPDDATKKIIVPAGGAEHMATLVRQLRAGRNNTVFVAAGDLIGASPFLSAMFHDEPTIESLSMMGLDVASVGNHEFDEGKDELLRMQNGGCHPIDGCQGPHPFAGAKFRYLAASTIEKSTGRAIFPPYEIKQFDGIPIAFIGLTLKGTPNLVSPPGVAGLEFKDEAETVNALVARTKGARRRGHRRADSRRRLSDRRLQRVPGYFRARSSRSSRSSTRPSMWWSAVTPIRPILARSTGGSSRQATNTAPSSPRSTSSSIRRRATSSAPGPTMSSSAPAFMPRIPSRPGCIDEYDKLAGPIANRVAGSITASLSRVPNDAGESVLGDLIADAQLDATRADDNGGAAIAFTNPGGIRSDISRRPDGAVSYADVFASQPFRNQLVTLTLTGAQIKNMLEQQWLDPARPRILQVSKGFSYAWDNTKPFGQRVIAERMSLNGQRIDPAAAYRVTVNNFLSVGGDGFTVLKDGAAPRFGIYDVDALYAYFQANSPISPAAPDRIARVN